VAVTLDDDELARLTNVHRRQKIRRYREQAAALTQMGISYIVRADGSLAVSRAHAESLLSGLASAKVARKSEPVANWDAV
jgi:hypothetical protein